MPAARLGRALWDLLDHLTGERSRSRPLQMRDEAEDSYRFDFAVSFEGAKTATVHIRDIAKGTKS